MISLHIEAETASEMTEQLLSFVSLFKQGDTAPADAGKAPSRRKAAGTAAEPSGSAAEASPPATTEQKRSVFDDDDDKPKAPTFTKEQLQELAMAFGAKHGDDALEALVTKHSTTGKFSGIPVTAYAALHAELTA